MNSKKLRRSKPPSNSVAPKTIHLRSVTSTNDTARVLADSGAQHGTTIIADVQTSGRGRAGSKWISPRGGLWMSIILRPERRLKRPALIPLLGSLAVTEALEKYGVHGRIKWPNDVIVEARKIGGILCESSVTGGSFQWIIVGIGVNVNNPPPILPSINSRYQATAVIQVKDKKTDLSALADSIRDSVLHLYDSLLANGVGNMLREYNKLHVLRNRKVRVLLSNHGIEGVAGEVDVEGRLSVKNSDGSTKMLQSEDVRVVDIL